MRNLKRTLSLALAAVMLLGMMVVGTSAASFPDVTSENNVEAISVIKAVGIMEGNEKGEFEPAKAVTRNEMAVVMANMMDLKVADYAGACKFTDVPDWAKNFVAACNANGIVSGTGATTYSGDSTVTAAEAGLMMMKALGYFQNAEDFGEDWKLSAVKQASKIELFKGISGGADAALTRNDVAQLALTSLKSDVVDQTGSKGSNITTSDGTVINMGYAVTYVSVPETTENYKTTAIDNIQQLAEKLYDSDLKLDTTTTPTKYGHKVRCYTYKNEVVTDYVATDKVLATKNSGITLANAIDSTDEDYVVGLEKAASGTSYAVTYYINGSADTTGKNDVIASYAAPTQTAADAALKGVIVEFIDTNDNGKADVVNIIKKSVATLTADASTKEVTNQDTQVKVPGVTGMGAFGTTNTVKTVSGYEGLKKGDVVLFYTSDGHTFIEKAQSVQGVATAKKSNNKIVVNGTEYATSALGNFSFANDYTNTYTYYLDNSGSIVKAVKETDTATENYAFVLKSAWVTGSGLEGSSYGQARLLKLDGTVEVVTVAEIDETEVNSNTVADDADNKFVTYSVNSDGEYVLTTKTSDDLAAASITKGDAKFDGATVGNANTIFLVNTDDADDPKVTVYTGTANVPSMTSLTASNCKVYASDGIAKYVYIITDTANISGETGEYVYIPGTGSAHTTLSYTYQPESKSGEGDDYYLFDAIVNGVQQDVKIKKLTSIVDAANNDNVPEAGVAVNTMYKVTDTNSDGVITALNADVTNDVAELTQKTGISYSAGTLKAGTDAYNTNEDTEVFYIAKDGAVTELVAADITNDTTDKVMIVETSDSGKTADVVYIFETISTTASMSAFTYVIDGVEAEVTESANTVVKSLTGKGGKTVSITEVTTAEGSWSVNGTAVVLASGGVSLAANQIVITVTAEDGTTTTTFTIGFQVDG